MGMENTDNLGLPYIMPSQAQKHVTHNDALRTLDAVIQITLVERGRNTPPEAPLAGSRYLVGPDATGEWAGHEGDITAYQDGGWSFFEPKAGWLAWIEGEARLVVFDGISWSDISADEPQTLARLGINTSPDPDARLAVKSDDILFSHDDVTPGSGDIQQTINRKTTANTASILFQTDYQGGAEIGLAGGTSLTIKVSPDGVEWLTPIDVAAAGDHVAIQTPLSVSGTLNCAPPVLADSTHLIHLTTERPWTIEQDGFGPGANLAFRSQTGGSKSVVFCNSDKSKTVQIMPFDQRIRIGLNDVLHTGMLDPSALRTGSYNVAALPSASAKGAGATIFIPDEAGGAVLGFSDGSTWRRVTDGAIVS